MTTTATTSAPPPAPDAMTTWDFCHWLRGFLDGAQDELGPDDIAGIRQRLEATIKKENLPPAVPPPGLIGPTWGFKW